MSNLPTASSLARVAWVAAWGLLSVGCVGPALTPDGGLEDAGTVDDGGAAASVLLRLVTAPEPLGAGVVLERLTLGVASVRAPNDRDELVRDIGLLVDLSSGPAELMFTGAEPAVYGSAEVMLATGPWGNALSLRVADGSRIIEVELIDDIDLAPRCAAPVQLATGGQLVLTLDVPVAELVELLRAFVLPAPVAGVIRVDRVTAPGVVHELTERLGGVHLQCGGLVSSDAD